ncbi:DedA family protein [Clostridium sp. A1-XYC3]|uniref:DedA family protein n=1 Tax=Clostridium tanneri TaxID=3037988 RepID=A0ABU4JWJ7_9CLOT|nr:DedA family protein [Clostridium sp. A1-XYC3]MDW8802532.1 DedA family protein [Clostridium sp. A1-XYC3]
MDLLKSFIDVIIHLDKYLNIVIQNYGTGTYLILFLIVFCETGLVVLPFLPGDSLLFAAGAFAALGSLNVYLLFSLLVIGAILGNTVNYYVGRAIGPKVFSKENVKFLNKEYLDKTQAFYDKHGGITIIVTRFMPIIRTFAPFVAGIGKMNFVKFMSYNIAGGVLWVALFVFGGYFFGNIPIVKKNFTVVIFAIIFISLLPAVIGVLKERFGKKKQVNESNELDNKII